MEPFKRLVVPGTIPREWGNTGKLKRPQADKVFITIEWTGSRLSITGVVGPKGNGDAWGSCGQCRDALQEITQFDSSWWMKTGVDRLAEIWDRWHLNDMRAGCEHQRDEGWDKRPIDPSKPTNAYGKHFEGQRSDSWNMLTWVSRSEHPEGLLSFPCPTCGYKFGTAWLREDVPEDVLQWLHDLPETAYAYPWSY